MATPKPRSRNVADLKASILNPSLTSTYETTFVFPPVVKQWSNSGSGIGNGINLDIQEKVQISCREAALPDTNLATHEQFNDFTGITERHAYRRQYSASSSFTFYVDVNYDVIYLFENWIRFIVNEDASNETLNNNNYTYRVNFPNEYKSQINIRKFEKDYSGRNLEYKFLNAYPVSINTMPLSYDASQILLCTVNFNFSRYIINSPNGFTRAEQSAKPFVPVPQERSSVINDSFGGTNGPDTEFVERDTATSARMDGGSDGPLLLPDGSPVRDSSGRFREMF